MVNCSSKLKLVPLIANEALLDAETPAGKVLEIKPVDETYIVPPKVTLLTTSVLNELHTGELYEPTVMVGVVFTVAFTGLTSEHPPAFVN